MHIQSQKQSNFYRICYKLQMKIQCPNCQSLFILEDNLIPKDGRLLQCSKCNHKWFYKHVDNKNIEASIRNKVDEIEEKPKIKKKDIRIANEKTLQQDGINQTIDDDKNIKKSKININYFSYFLVFIISIVAFIIIIDTFKDKLAFIFPNINFLLNNLYETLKDLILFFNNLIS